MINAWAGTETEHVMMNETAILDTVPEVIMSLPQCSQTFNSPFPVQV